MTNQVRNMTSLKVISLYYCSEYMIKLEIFLQITEDNFKRSLKNNRTLVFKLRKYLNSLIFKCNVLLPKEKISNNAGIYHICNAFLNITTFFLIFLMGTYVHFLFPN